MNTQTQTHVSLLERLAQGSPDGSGVAWGEFVDRYGELLRGFCRARGLDATDTDDVVQDVLLSLSRAMPGFTYDPSRGKFRSYLKTVALHAIFRKSRQDAGASGLGEVESLAATATGDPAADAHWEGEWRQYHLRLAMRTVEVECSARDLEAFHRYAVRGEDAGSVSEELGLSMNALYQIKSRITRRLAALVERQVSEEG
jgi:RNA polymerase sigma-70 factor (ECF subfamily)